MEIIANIVGLIAVILFTVSYQFKKKSGIIICSVLSRASYVLQYVLLGAFTGAVIDLTAGIVSYCAGLVENPRFKKYSKLIIILSYVALLLAGILSYENIFSILVLVGTLIEVSAFWMKSEKGVLIISLFAPPFWFAYNVYSLAIVGAAGNVFTFVSVVIGLYKYYKIRRKPKI